MSEYTFLMLGNMLARVAGPYAQDLYERRTESGRQYARRKDAKEQEKRSAETAEKLKISKAEHQLKLEQMREHFKNDLILAENKFASNIADKQYQTFLKSCFPLRNPYDMNVMFMVKHDINAHLVGKSMKVVHSSDGQNIVPIRIIAAMPGIQFPMSQDIKSGLSLFLVNNFGANSRHAVLSDIGSWKDDIPATDASVNYLYMALQGQPTMVLVPEFLDGGNTIQFKIWSWGLGGDLPYPAGFDFGQLDLKKIENEILLEELRKYAALLKKAGIKNETVNKAMVLVNTIDDHNFKISEEERQLLLSQIQMPDELRKTGVLQKRLRCVTSTAFSVICGMYADAYHLMNYGTEPMLPSVLPTMQGVEIMLPEIRDYYIALANTACAESIFTNEMAARFELQLLESMKQISDNADTLRPLIDDFYNFYIDLDRKTSKELNPIVRQLQLKNYETRREIQQH